MLSACDLPVAALAVVCVVLLDLSLFGLAAQHPDCEKLHFGYVEVLPFVLQAVLSGMGFCLNASGHGRPQGGCH